MGTIKEWLQLMRVQKLMITKVCQFCGKELTVRNKKFCDRQCYSRWLSENPIGICREKIENKLPREIRKCPICGKEFEVRINMKKKYCSKRCYHKDPAVRKIRSECRKGDKNSARRPEVRRRIGETVEKIWRRHRELNIPYGHQGIPHTPEVRKKCASYGMKGKRHSHEVRLKIAETVARAFARMHKYKPNRIEDTFSRFLDKYFPEEYRYNDGWFILFGRIPDFVNVNGRKKLIEIAGRHWHTENEMETRKLMFAKAGYDTLVLWDDTLKDLDEKGVYRIVREFTYGQN